MSDGRIAWVDIARVIAIVLVVGFHVAYEFTLDNGLRPIGFLGVSLFFIASGYMLAMKYPQLDSFSLNWLKKRWLRVATVYYPALVCVSLLFIGGDLYARARDLAMHFLFLNWTSPDLAYSIISPAWFLVPLMGLYILFPFLNRIMRKSAWFLLPAFLLTIAYRHIVGGIVDFSPIFFLGEFCFGIAVAHGEKRWQVLGLALLPALVSPVMAVPFGLFVLLGSLGAGVGALPGILVVIAANTFEIFLFHESVMKTALGEWSILGQGVAMSLAILAAAIALTMLASKQLALYVFKK
jgi:peptidoglycan/LPS O-acetylase OafA/YrhL